MKINKALIWICYILLILINYYLFIPALNWQSGEFWSFLIFHYIIFAILKLTLDVNILKGRKFYQTKKAVKYSIPVLGVFAFIILTNVVFSPLFSSDIYKNRIEIDKNSSFYEDVKEADFSKLPLLDRASSSKVGDRVMGEMIDLVSQFYVSELYTQINYNDTILRVTPLEYNGLIKYFTNRSNGVKGYIAVDSTTGTSELIKLEKGMKYVESAFFNENVYRKLRFSYPTKIFDSLSFEIDNDGNPYWIAPILNYRGVSLLPDVDGLVILNAIDGSSKYYDIKDVPSWVDHVYNADLILEQVNDWGLYTKGFWNSIFGQKDVVTSTEGYNYMVMNDDVYLYTGITSVSSDESNLGFILTNMRTKDTKFYSIPGAEEYSAMDSAKGKVQQMNYTATFPLLINLNNQATYLISLKDNAGLVKMYAFVNVQDYQKVVVTDASNGIKAAANNYLKELGSEINESKLISKMIELKSVVSAVIDGNTYYYLTDTNNNKYVASININKNILPFLTKNSKVNVSYYSDESGIIEIKKIK